jgi:hypothetical protein
MQNICLNYQNKSLYPVKLFSTLFILSISISCSGQVPTPAQQSVVGKGTDSVPTASQSPKDGIIVNPNPAREDGYSFIDETGTEIYYLSENEIQNRNPYIKNTIPARKTSGEGFYQQFDGLTTKEIRKTLPTCLKSSPSDIILKKAGVITASLVNVELNPDDPFFLIITYALEIFDKENLVADWTETTIHVYNKKGNLISNINDSHNIQGAFISPDGKYIIANEIIDRIGDGVSEIPASVIIYDVLAQKIIGRLNNEAGNYYTDVRRSIYEKNMFLLYSSLGSELEDARNFKVIKLIIDPGNKKVYHKEVVPTENLPPALRLKSTTVPQGEDIKTYKIYELKDTN